MVKNKKDRLGEPTKALSSYNIFYREHCSEENRDYNISFREYTKQITEKYRNLTPTQLQYYKDLANKDRERYIKDMNAFKKTENYKKLMQRRKQQNSTIPKSKTQNSVEIKVEKSVDIGQINIFTTEFLDHNQQREEKLRNLRKQCSQLDEQTSLLSKHIDNLTTATANQNQLCDNYTQSHEKLDQLHSYLYELCRPLSSNRNNVTTSDVDNNNMDVVIYHVRQLNHLLKDKSANKEVLAKVKDKLKNLPSTAQLEKAIN